MTTDNRIERRLPELLEELAAARVPDYLDSLLQQTARTRQRPAWSSLERWLPMGVVARPVPFRLPSWRLVLLAAALVALAAAASALLFAGSRPHLPPQFGPARNGLVLFSTPAGEIDAVDPVSGKVTVVPVGAGTNVGPWMAPDGRRFIFVHTGSTSDQLFVANIDGSGAHAIPASTDRNDWLDWSPDSSRLVILPKNGSGPSIVDAASGAATPLTLPYKAAEIMWIPQTPELVAIEPVVSTGGVMYHVIDTTGRELRSYPGPGAGDGGSTSLAQDGVRLTYHSWQTGPGLQGRVHILNLTTGEDRLLTPNLNDGYIWEQPVFSPDGSLVLVNRYPPHTTQVQMAILRVDGTGSPVLLGTPMENGTSGAYGYFSPDGTQVLANFSSDGSAWLFPVTGGLGQKLTWGENGFTWQRAAW